MQSVHSSIYLFQLCFSLKLYIDECARGYGRGREYGRARESGCAREYGRARGLGVHMAMYMGIGVCA